MVFRRRRSNGASLEHTESSSPRHRNSTASCESPEQRGLPRAPSLGSSPISQAGSVASPVAQIDSTDGTTPSPYGEGQRRTAASSLDLPEARIPIHIATIELSINGELHVLRLGKWNVSKLPDMLLLKWIEINTRECLEHQIPYGVFPSTLHREVETKLKVSFLQKHHLIFTDATGKRYDEHCVVTYVFEKIKTSNEFQGDVRGMSLLQTFDFENLRSERYPTGDGEAAFQNIKIWQCLQQPFCHTLSFFSTMESSDLEISTLTCKVPTRTQRQSRTVIIDFIRRTDSMQDVNAPTRRKSSFGQIFHRDKSSLSKRGSISSTDSAAHGVVASLNYLEIIFAGANEAEHFLDIFEQARSADHLINFHSFKHPLWDVQIQSDKSLPLSPSGEEKSCSDGFKYMEESESTSPKSTPPNLQLNRSPLPRRATAKEIIRVRPGFIETNGQESLPDVAIKLLDHNPQPRYHYSPLETENKLRLLKIKSAKKQDELIYCEIIQSTNEEQPEVPYEALSYTWGTENDFRDIHVFSQAIPTETGGQKYFSLRVRTNLYSAIQNLRRETEDVVLWVDAICINQDDNSERNAQVKMMSDIYRRADNVIIWLGEGTPEIDGLLKFIEDMYDASRRETFLTDKSTVPQWLAFRDLMRYRWFSRRWVIQEVALAKRPTLTLHCGRSAIFWTYFAEAVEMFEENFDRINALVRNSQLAGSHTNPLKNARTGAHVLVEAIHRNFEWVNGKIEHRSNLETLVSELTSFESTDPRDTIFAILSLAKDTADTRISTSKSSNLPRLEPDYNKPLLEVLKEFVHYAIESSGSLDIICRAWAPVLKKKGYGTVATGLPSISSSIEQWPSWILTVKRSAYGTAKERLEGRQNGDSFAGHPNSKFYKASQNTIAKYRFSQNLRPHHTPFPETGALGISNIDASPIPRSPLHVSLFVKGFPVDSVETVSSSIAKGFIHHECLDLFAYYVPDDDDDTVIPDPPEALWRTMVANRAPDGAPTKSFYPRAFKSCLSKSSNGDIDINTLIMDNDDHSMVEFLKRVRSVVWNRRFLRTQGTQLDRAGTNVTSKQLFGLAPAEAKVTDIICVLLGCSVPVILREHREPDHYFEFIGEAYVHGLMEGEVIEGRDRDRLQFECMEFELR